MIRNRAVYAERAWDWDFLNECFAPSRIRPADIDGVVERNGCFLFLEAKPADKAIDIGQRILFDALTRQPRTTVLVLYGEPSVPAAMQVWPHDRMDADTATVCEFVGAWFEWANRQKRQAA